MIHTKKNREKKKVNLWKWLFLGLVALILGGGIFLYSRLFLEKPTYQTQLPQTTQVKKSPNFQVLMTKKQFNTIVNHYLNQHNSKDLNLNFNLNDNAQLTGSIKIFEQSLPFRLIMDVAVLKNKDLLLKPKVVSMGNLNISLERVLQLIQTQVRLPGFITINAKKGEIVMTLDKIKVNKNMSFKIDTIDLANDRIIFNGYLK